MPFGMTNTPAKFVSMMNNVLSRFFYKFLLVFIDDILIYSKNGDEHKETYEKFCKFLENTNYM